MGIKGIYKEIGPGERVSLCKLAIDHLEQTGEPLRLAIDFAIWSFQAQAAKGGANPAIRTLFYRLVRLLSHTITPIFVFDGPNKPAFKRKRLSRGPGNTVSAAMAKRLIRLFGFAIHDAPGEAEADCALLQREGVVDAVLSEDVDTIMFGCGRMLRNWSCVAELNRSAGSTAVKPPTHVSVYDISALRQGETGLDREGLVLVALMSGGDYLPEGVPGCGVKVACEAARAGFGRRLCRIKRAEELALHEWREDLRRELRTNASKFFRVKHTALTIPDEFPNMEVLRYYTHPVVSRSATVETVRGELSVRREVDVTGLRAFTAETYDWSFKIGAIKFMRVLGPGLLAQRLLNMSRQVLESDDSEIREEWESKAVRAIHNRRVHAGTDGTPELRISFIPTEIVGIDLDAEEEDATSTFGRSGLALNSDDAADKSEDEAKCEPKNSFDPFQPNLIWVPETVAKLGVPLTVEDWEGKQRAKKNAPAKKSLKKPSNKPRGARHRLYSTATSSSSTGLVTAKEQDSLLVPSASQSPPTLPNLSPTARSQRKIADFRDVAAERPSFTTKSCTSSKSKANMPAARPLLGVKPWSIASSQTIPKTPGYWKSREYVDKPTETILISSSPVALPSSPRATTSAVLPALDENAQQASSRDDEIYLDASSTPTRTQEIEKGYSTSDSPGICTLSTAETTVQPAAKRTQRTRAAKPNRQLICCAKTAQRRATPSIKDFGRISKQTVPYEAKLSPSINPFELDDEESDDELEDLTSLGTKGPHEQTAGLPLPPLRVQVSEDDIGRTKNPSTPNESDGAACAVIQVLSSSPTAAGVASPAPFDSQAKASTNTTRIYMPRAGDASLDFFCEVEVTHEEADRMMREDDGRKGGRRMWKESDVSIWDLTGDTS